MEEGVEPADGMEDGVEPAEAVVKTLGGELILSSGPDIGLKPFGSMSILESNPRLSVGILVCVSGKYIPKKILWLKPLLSFLYRKSFTRAS